MSNSSHYRGRIFIISSPSGGGKTTLMTQLLAQNGNLARSISMTTRTPRTGEKNGEDYIFVSKDEFENIKKKDGFLESAEVFGQQYGTPRAFVEQELNKGKDVLLVIDVQGAMLVKEKCPDAVRIFIDPPSMEELEKRLRNRQTDSEESIQRRLKIARDEMAQSRVYEHRVTNKDLNVAVAETSEIIRRERIAK